jgi:DNA mismatch repair protein MutL
MANAGSTMGQDVATGSCIQALPQQLINQIAAGEVVERPASVVKELAENALDAGATRVEIQISADARTIRVADNGVGMTAADLRLAFQNHATSKIRTLDDLFHISTLGFRGEALASIAAIAQVTCQTRTATAEAGLETTFDPSGQPIIQPVGCAAGTVMHVNDLFYNTPARLKFMKRASTEVAHIQEWVENLALGHPHVQWELRLQDRTVLKTTGKMTPLLSTDGEGLKTSSLLVSATQQVFKLSAEVPLIPFAAEDASAGFAMSGVLGPPDQTKSTKRWMVVMVNQRIIRCPLLLKAIESAFETLLPHGRYPIAVLQLTLPAEQIDVNVHPTKREIRYAQGGAML